MLQTDLSSKAQQIIDRLAAINYENPNIDEQRIRDAFSRHLEALNLPDYPVEIYRSFDVAFDAVSKADRNRKPQWKVNTDAAWSDALHTVKEAALEAAWGDAFNTAFRQVWVRRAAEAIATFNQAIQLQPDDANSWYNKACHYVENGEVAEAIPSLQRALELNSDFADILATDKSFAPIRDHEQFQQLLKN